MSTTLRDTFGHFLGRQFTGQNGRGNAFFFSLSNIIYFASSQMSKRVFEIGSGPCHISRAHRFLFLRRDVDFKILY